MKRSRQDEIVICRELLQSGLELALVDEAAGFVDDDEGVDDPGKERKSAINPSFLSLLESLQ